MTNIQILATCEQKIGHLHVTRQCGNVPLVPVTPCLKCCDVSTFYCFYYVFLFSFFFLGGGFPYSHSSPVCVRYYNWRQSKILSAYNHSMNYLFTAWMFILCSPKNSTNLGRDHLRRDGGVTSNAVCSTHAVEMEKNAADGMWSDASGLVSYVQLWLCSSVGVCVGGRNLCLWTCLIHE